MKYSKNDFSHATPVNRNKWGSNYFVVSQYSLNNGQFGQIFFEERERNICYLLKSVHAEKLRLNSKTNLINETQLAREWGVWDWQLKPQISE